MRVHGLQTVARLVAPWKIPLEDREGSTVPDSRAPLTITASGPDESDAELENWLSTFEAQEVISFCTPPRIKLQSTWSRFCQFTSSRCTARKTMPYSGCDHPYRQNGSRLRATPPRLQGSAQPRQRSKSATPSCGPMTSLHCLKVAPPAHGTIQLPVLKTFELAPEESSLPIEDFWKHLSVEHWTPVSHCVSILYRAGFVVACVPEEKENFAR